MKVLVAWSGGKDSHASLIWACERFGAKNIEAVFCDTSWEHEYTYKQVTDVCELLGVALVTLKSSKYDGMVDLAIKKGRMPSVMARFCTEELKTKPMIDYTLSLEQHVIIIQGIRADESNARSLMSEQCRYFKYYFEPYKISGKYDSVLKLSKKQISETDKKSVLKLIGHIYKKYKIGIDQKDFILKLSEINKLPENEINHFHTYRKKEVIDFCLKYADDIIRPCFDWTGIEVMNYIIEHGHSPNPLYFKGAKRVGCYPCVMCGKDEIKNIIENDPDHIDKIRNAEKESGSTFFGPDYIPKRYHTGADKKGNTFCYIDDVVRYITDKNAQADLFKEVEKEKNIDRRCMSFYGICE